MSSQISLKLLVFDVAHAVGVVVAAGDYVAVFGYAHEFAKEASAQEEVVVPVRRSLACPAVWLPVRRRVCRR